MRVTATAAAGGEGIDAGIVLTDRGFEEPGDVKPPRQRRAVGARGGAREQPLHVATGGATVHGEVSAKQQRRLDRPFRRRRRRRVLPPGPVPAFAQGQLDEVEPRLGLGALTPDQGQPFLELCVR